jgi:hypothetical protein
MQFDVQAAKIGLLGSMLFLLLRKEKEKNPSFIYFSYFSVLCFQYFLSFFSQNVLFSCGIVFTNKWF